MKSPGTRRFIVVLAFFLAWVTSLARAAEVPDGRGRALVAQASTGVARPERTVNLRDVKQTIDGPVLLRITQNDWQTLTHDATTTNEPFRGPDAFLKYMPLPDGAIGVFDPCFSATGLNCMAKFTALGWVCKCSSLPGAGDLQPPPPTCRLAFESPLTEGVSSLVCVSQKACPTCCRLVKRVVGKTGEIGCRCPATAR